MTGKFLDRSGYYPLADTLLRYFWCQDNYAPATAHSYKQDIEHIERVVSDIPSIFD